MWKRLRHDQIACDPRRFHARPTTERDTHCVDELPKPFQRKTPVLNRTATNCVSSGKRKFLRRLARRFRIARPPRGNPGARSPGKSRGDVVVENARSYWEQTDTTKANVVRRGRAPSSNPRISAGLMSIVCMWLLAMDLPIIAEGPRFGGDRPTHPELLTARMQFKSKAGRSSRCHHIRGNSEPTGNKAHDQMPSISATRQSFVAQPQTPRSRGDRAGCSHAS